MTHAKRTHPPRGHSIALALDRQSSPESRSNWACRRNANTLSAIVALSALLLLDISARAQTRDADQARNAVDQQTALAIGEYTVSHYLTDKYYGRFADDIRQRHQRPPLANESKEWLDLFVAKQVVIAHARSLGYLARPEVRSTVDRMERYMLSQSNGPFYRQLYEQQREPTASLEEFYLRTFKVSDIVIIRFPNDAAMASGLGDDFDQVSLKEQTRRVLACRAQEGVVLHEGPTAWPYAPFTEIGDSIAAAPTGRWIAHRDPLFGTYYIFLRETKIHPPGDFAAARENFSRFMQHVHEQTIRLRRRRELLAKAAFSLETTTAQNLAEFCATLALDAAQIPTLSPSLGVAPLARYRIEKENVTITADEYRQNFNGRFIRQIPRNPTQLRESAENVVVEELDVREARANGVDLTPQFVEDRRGFAGFQALDLFENEILTAQLGIGPAEIERYYNNHADEFRRTTRIRGRLLTFSSMEKASAWLQQTAADAAGISPDQSEEIEVSRDRPVVGLERLHEPLLLSPEGTTFGPFPRGQFVVLFLKTKNLQTGLIPLADATHTIRAKLLRPALDARILELAREIAPEVRIKDTIDYTRYDLSSIDRTLLLRQ
jgi:hypothetical protein